MTTRGLIRRKVVSAITKYLCAWSMLLTTPSAFLTLSLEDKAKHYISPWPFFLWSLIVVPAILQPIDYLALHFLNISEQIAPVSPLDFDSAPYRSALNLTFLAALWYFVFITLLGLKTTVRTSAPSRRILYELLYVYSGPVQFYSLASMTLGFVFLACVSAIHLAPLNSQTLVDIVNLSVVLIYLTLAGILPLLIIPLRYDVLVATTLFPIGRLRAYLTCSSISLFAFVVLFAINIWSMVLFPWRLTATERQAVDCLFSLAHIEATYYSAIHSNLPLDQLIREFSNPPRNLLDFIVAGRQPEDIRNIKFLQAGKLNQYVFVAYFEKIPPYIEAVPRRYNPDTKNSFLVFCTNDPDTVVTAFGGDHRGGLAMVSDARLFPPLILRYGRSAP